MLRPRFHVPLMIACLALPGCDWQQPVARDEWPIGAAAGAASADDVAWLDPQDARTIVVGGQRILQADGDVFAICALRNGSLVALGDGSPLVIEHGDGGWKARKLPPLPYPIRAAASDPSGSLAIITGGVLRNHPERASDEAEPAPWVLGAEGRMAGVGENGLTVGEVDVQADWSPWRVKTGHFAGEDDALVFVYKSTPFDPIVRPRPFVYSIVGDPPRLKARWRGTSFSHPFVDATFGDFTGSGEGEIAALEVGENSERLLTAYHFEGFGLAGLAPTIELGAVSDKLIAADVCGDGRHELIVESPGPERGFIAYGLTDGPEPRLERVAIAPLTTDTDAWCLLARDNGQLAQVAYLDGRKLQTTRFQVAADRG